MERLGPAHVAREATHGGTLLGSIKGDCRAVEGISCAVTGSIDWLYNEYSDIQLKEGAVPAVLAAYRQLGLGLLDVIGGRFSVALWDATNRTGMVATDRFGQVPVFWTNDRNGDLVFGPTTFSVFGQTGDKPPLSEQGIFNYLYFHMVPGPQTIFAGINKLMAAGALIFTDGKWQEKTYWQPTFDEYADGPQAEAGEQMIGLLSSSVARCAGDSDAGAFLSGGLDSSTVAGLLARHREKPPTYSIGFDAEGYDEIAFARIASERFGTVFNPYYVTPEDVLAALPTIAAAYDEPFGNSSALPAYFCANIAVSDGRSRLLAGDGGDEIFAGNERYVKQEVFERYRLIPGIVRKALLEPIANSSLGDRIRLVGKARSYFRQANIPLPDRLQTYNFLNRLGAQNIVSEELWNVVDPELPLELDRELYERPAGASRMNRMLYLDWQHTLTDNDLRKVTRMCELAGIEVAYPMLDDRLVEFSTRVSSQRKTRGNRLRDFYKKAVAGFLPDEIINKSKHGFGLPFGVWMAEHAGLKEIAADNLERMRRRPFVRSEFIDEIVRLHGGEHSGYYGEFVWILIMLELWLTAHGYEP